jgi:hypothetical protein
MKINWKRVVIAAILSELLILLIYFPARLNDIQGRQLVTLACFLVFPFWAGLWAVGASDSRFLLHGLLVAVISNVIYLLVEPMVLPNETERGIVGTILILLHPFKLLAAGFGAYVGGRRRRKLSSRQVAATTG